MKLPLRDFADVITALKGLGGDRSTGTEKRGAARMGVTAKVNVHLFENDRLGRMFSALTRDISLTGCGLMQAVALSSQQRVIIELPRPHTPLFVVSFTTHCRPLADGLLAVGFEFLKIASKETCDQLINGDTEQHAHIRESILG